MGEIRGHSKMEGLQRFTDLKSIEKAGSDSLDFRTSFRFEPMPYFLSGQWADYCSSFSFFNMFYPGTHRIFLRNGVP